MTKSLALSLVLAIAALTLANGRYIQFEDGKSANSEMRQSETAVQVCSRDALDVMQIVGNVINTVIDIVQAMREQLGAFLGSSSDSDSDGDDEWPDDWPEDGSMKKLYQLRNRVKNLQHSCWKKL